MHRANLVPDLSPCTMDLVGWKASDAVPFMRRTLGAMHCWSSRASTVGGKPSRSAALPSLTQLMES